MGVVVKAASLDLYGMRRDVLRSEVAIRKQRKKCGYTQESFDFHCGLHRNYISGVERGVRNISLENIIKVASSLNLKVSELFILAGM